MDCLSSEDDPVVKADQQLKKKIYWIKDLTTIRPTDEDKVNPRNRNELYAKFEQYGRQDPDPESASRKQAINECE